MGESGAYQLVRRIGSGPGGPVYLARGVAGEVALRQFESSEPAGSEAWRSDRDRFLTAARQQMILTDPSIVQTLDVVETPEEASVVMQYVDAETLQTALLNRQFSPDEANRLLRRVALALDFAHSRGVIHGDVKPSNIFVLPSQEVMVGDFAISPRARRDPLQFLPLNLTHGFLSPEHFNFPMLLEARSDQYSLAVIAYRMYTGQLPFGDSPDYLTAVLAEDRAPSRVNRRLPPNIDPPLMRALSRNPAHRFASCMEFVSELSANLITAPETRLYEAGPPTMLAGQAGQSETVKEKRSVLPLIAGGLAALLALIAGFLIFRPGKKEEPPVTATAPPVQASITPPSETPAPSKKKAKAVIPPADLPHKVAKAEPKPKPFREAPPAPPVRTPDPPKRERPAPKATPPVEVARITPPANAGVPARGAMSSPASTPGITPPRPVDPPPVVPAGPAVKVQALSRDQAIPKGGSFSIADPTLGELGHGDLKAQVRVDGPLTPRSKVTIEWSVNGVVTDRQKPVSPGRVVEYNNEPTSGTYKITIRVDGRPVDEFSFRITP